MIKVKDDTEMWFGKHKGKKMANVPAGYLLYLYNNKMAYGNLLTYIEENLDALQLEIGKEEK